MTNQIEILPSGAEKVDTYIRLFHVYRDINTDSAIFCIEKAENEAKKINNPKKIGDVKLNYGILCRYTNEFDKSENYYLEAIDIYRKHADSLGVSSGYNNLGSLMADLGKFSEALNYYLSALRIDESLQDLGNLANSYNNVGLIHYNLENYDKAMDYYLKSLDVRKQLGDTLEFALIYNNIGILYYFEEKYEKTLQYFNMALEIWERYGRKRRMAMPLYNLAELYMELFQYKEALSNIQKATTINEELCDSFELISNYNLMAEIYQKRKDYKNAEINYLKALELTKVTKSFAEIHAVYGKISDFYEETGNPGKALKFFKEYHALNDSIFNLKSTEAMAKMQAEYDRDKKLLLKDAQIKQQAVEKQKMQAEKAKQQTINIFLIVGLGLASVLGIVIFMNYKRKKRDNLVLTLKNEEIRQQKEEIEAQRDEIECQRDEIEIQRDSVMAQRDLISKQKKSLDDSIVYAERIQRALLPSREMLKKEFEDYFISFLPRDVVSGDFYWSTRMGKSLIIAAADCTGHGVPGALMSMLGISFLNEIVNGYGIQKTNEIANRLREMVIQALKQKELDSTQKDGMDLAIVNINMETLSLSFTGANNPLYIISNNSRTDLEKYKSAELQDVALYEIKGDKMPAAIHVVMQPFNSTNIKIFNGDSVYLFSDGFADQFGGETINGKKFKYKAFKDLLLKINNKPMCEQKEIIEKTFFNWKGAFMQMDDLLVMGIRVFSKK
ncbi:MAG: tetratricopeptide repeat protein [Bacteroidales bacterium]|nr:tetratricopeptide repeat protein [Bacteroidales bacterium]